jgi:hypothetical protein
MIEQHYAGVIENWDRRRVPAERQILAARRTSGRKMDANPKTDELSAETNPVQIRLSRRPDSNRGPLHYE